MHTEHTVNTHTQYTHTHTEHTVNTHTHTVHTHTHTVAHFCLQNPRINYNFASEQKSLKQSIRLKISFNI